MNTVEASTLPSTTNRIRNFALFFKNYMSVSSLLVASLPIPATALNLIPVYNSQRELLSVYSSLFCFLILGFIFFMRHVLAKLFFPDIAYVYYKQPKFRGLFSVYVQLFPLIFIGLSVTSAFEYQDTYRSSLLVAQAEHAAALQGGQFATAYLQEMRQAKTSAEEVSLAEEFMSQAQLLASTDPAGMNDLARQIAIARAPAMLSKNDRGLTEWPTDSSETPIRLTSAMFLNSTDRVAEGSPIASVFLKNFVGLPKPSELGSADLKSTEAQLIPLDTRLMFYYLGMFVFAEAAFTLMAMKEYLQDLLDVSEKSLIIRGYVPEEDGRIGRKKRQDAAIQDSPASE